MQSLSEAVGSSTRQRCHRKALRLLEETRATAKQRFNEPFSFSWKIRPLPPAVCVFRAESLNKLLLLLSNKAAGAERPPMCSQAGQRYPGTTSDGRLLDTGTRPEPFEGSFSRRTAGVLCFRFPEVVEQWALHAVVTTFTFIQTALFASVPPLPQSALSFPAFSPHSSSLPFFWIFFYVFIALASKELLFSPPPPPPEHALPPVYVLFVLPNVSPFFWAGLFFFSSPFWSVSIIIIILRPSFDASC